MVRKIIISCLSLTADPCKYFKGSNQKAYFLFLFSGTSCIRVEKECSVFILGRYMKGVPAEKWYIIGGEGASTFKLC